MKDSSLVKWKMLSIENISNTPFGDGLLGIYRNLLTEGGSELCISGIG